MPANIDAMPASVKSFVLNSAISFSLRNSDTWNLNRSKFRPPEPQLQKILLQNFLGTSPYRAEVKLAGIPEVVCRTYNLTGAAFVILSAFTATKNLRVRKYD
jgi:hypothetical protein